MENLIKQQLHVNAQLFFIRDEKGDLIGEQEEN